MLDMDMDMFQKYFTLALIAIVVNRSYDVLAHMKCNFDLEEMLDDYLNRFFRKDYHDDNRKLTVWGMGVLLALNMCVFYLLNEGGMIEGVLCM